MTVSDREVRVGAPSALGVFPDLSSLRVAIVHDYLTQRGGAERVVLAFLEMFQNARLITSVYKPEGTFPEFKNYQVETTWLNRWSTFRNDPRKAMPLLAGAFGATRLDDVDLVICSSSGWSHGIQTDAPKLVYCYNPARWLYQSDQYLAPHGAMVGLASRLSRRWLTAWDRRAAESATHYMTLSHVVNERISRQYGIDATVVAPPVTLDPDAQQEPIPGIEPGYFLTVSRARGYKNVAAVAAAMARLDGERLVIVGGLPEGDWPESVLGVEDLTDAQLRWLYANCVAVVAASHEDFGLTPVEGYAFGKPSLCLRAGGFLDTMREGEVGVFFEQPTPEAIESALRVFRARHWDRSKILRHAARFSFPAFRERVLHEARVVLDGYQAEAADQKRAS